jgi:GxGYxYP putative glycoside hydrolase C-terminal domain/GxGYxY sequence motif in domain of unknown function N-terminal/NPCBM-associated, NEW3 domain of alpha-galactosidase
LIDMEDDRMPRPVADRAVGGAGYSRRTFLQLALATPIAVGLGTAGVASSAAGATLDAGASNTSASPAEVYTYDLSYLNDYDIDDSAQVAAAYDIMHLVSALQGLVNRSAPRLFVNFVVGDQEGPLDLDQYWLATLQDTGQWLETTTLTAIPTLAALVAEFRADIDGVVVWDPAVAATSNVASTVAGAESLLPVRYDTSAASLYSTFVSSAGPDSLPAKVWLLDQDGSSLFTGAGTIPGTSLPSSGSAKCDAYLWAKTTYLDTGRSNASEIGYYLDAYWLTAPNQSANPYPMQYSDLTNHDYIVANSGFVLDLCPFADILPEDDPTQPLGTDFRTFEAILQSAYQQVTEPSRAQPSPADRGLIAVHGFVPWPWKYSSSASSTDPKNPAAGEWSTTELVTSYNGYIDADASGLDSMVNASLYQHYPLDAFYPQNPKPTVADLVAAGYVDATGAVVPKRYVAVYSGDYDSAAWAYHALPRLWDNSARGQVVMNWAFDPNLAQRMAPALVYTRRTRSDLDFFIAGDSGAGYINPGALEPPRPDSTEPSALDAWTSHCVAEFGRWDLSLTGFVIDGFSDPLSQDALVASYGRFSPDGVVGQRMYPIGLKAGLPFLRQAGDLPGEAPAAEAAFLEATYLTGDLDAPPLTPTFAVVRETLQAPNTNVAIFQQVQSDLPDAAVEFVDAYTLMGLVRQHFADRVTVAAERALVAPGQPTPVLLSAVSHRASDAEVTVSLEVPAGWRVAPSRLVVSLAPEEYRQLSFVVTPPATVNGARMARVAPAAWPEMSTKQQADKRLMPRAAETTPPEPGTTVTLTALVDGVAVPFAADVVAESYAAAPDVSVSLGSTVVSHGLTQVEESFNGNTTAATVGGVACLQLVITNNGFTPASFIYFAVDETYAFDELDAAAAVKVTYFDAPGQSFSIEYDGPDGDRPMDGVFTPGATLTTAGTNTWRETTFDLPRVYFGTRQMASPDYRAPGVADFRLASTDPIAVSSVQVKVRRGK